MTHSDAVHEPGTCDTCTTCRLYCFCNYKGDMTLLISDDLGDPCSHCQIEYNEYRASVLEGMD